MADKFLSEVIDFNRDIAPYRIIQIYSGVGAFIQRGWDCEQRKKK